VFGSGHERCNLDRRKNGGVEEERKEAGTLNYKRDDGEGRRRAAYRSRKDENAVTSASQMNKSAIPANRVGKENSSAKRRSEGRARLCGGGRVGSSGGVGGGVPASGHELTEAATDCDGEGTLGVDGASGVGGDGAGVASAGVLGEVRVGDCGGEVCGGRGELCTFLIVWTVRL